MFARRPHRFHFSRQEAYTLVELLIVIMIAILLAVVTLPAAKQMMEDARPREASRILNSTIVTSQARAQSTGRPVGVEFVLQRMNDPGAMTAVYQCTQLYMCEVPALYAGDTTSAVATVDLTSGMGGIYNLFFQDQVPNNLTMPPNTGSDNTTATISHLTDIAPKTPGGTGGAEDLFEIRFDHRGPWYTARRSQMMNNAFQISMGSNYPIAAGSTMGNWRYASFQIRRPPQRVGNAVELPRGTCIDMAYSGVGTQGIEFGVATALRMMFSPNGSIHSLTMAQPGMSQPGMMMPPPVVSTSPALGTVHFLVGVSNKINVPLDPSATHTLVMYDPEYSNLADGNALWVSISRSTGIVTTNENNPAPYNSVSNHAMSATQLAYLTNSRQFATAREQKGGK